MKNEIVAFLQEGMSYTEIRQRTGAAKATISYHAKRLNDGKPSQYGAARRYNWQEVQRFHDEGHNVAECRRQFGFCSASWAKAVQAGRISKRDPRIPIEQLLVEGRGTCRGHLKDRLFDAGLLQNRCSVCGISTWLDKPLTLHLDHINGRNDDDRLENLRMLCPNCHSQTETYCGGNVGKAVSRRRKTKGASSIV